MRSRVPKARGGGTSAGFTLVEALAAFAIVAVLSLVVERGVVQARAGLSSVEDRLAAERVARSLLAEPLRAADVGAGGRTGILDGYPYVIRLAMLELPLPEAEPEAQGGCSPSAACDPAGETDDLTKRNHWTLLRQDIAVTTRRGSAVAVETIRLGQVSTADDRHR